MFSSVASAYKGAKKDEINTYEWLDNGMTDLYREDTKENVKYRMDMLFGFSKRIDGNSISSLTHYGLGLKRSLDQFILFTGINTRLKIVYDDRCKQLNWIPFTYDRDPLFSENDVWGYGPEVLFAGDTNVPLVTGSIVVLQATISKLDKNYLDEQAKVKSSKKVYNFWFIDNVINKVSLIINNDIGYGHSIYIIKLLLLAVPIIFIVIALALHTIFDINTVYTSIKRL